MQPLIKNRCLLLSLAVALASAKQQAQNCGCELVMTDPDIVLGVDAFDVSVLADLYYCHDDDVNREEDQDHASIIGSGTSQDEEQADTDTRPPLLVFAGGAGVPKSKYSLAASAFVQRGYQVMVLEHTITMFGPPMSFVTAPDIAMALEYATTKIDFDQAALLGHSFGGTSVLYALNEQCGPFCGPTPVPVPLDPHVKAAVAYGSSLLVTTPMGHSWINDTDNGANPFCIINGQGDETTLLQVAGENAMLGTYERLVPTKVVATLAGLDHYSIVDEIIPNDTRNDAVSTKSRDFQVATAVDALDLWLERQGIEKPSPSRRQEEPKGTSASTKSSQG